MIRRVQREDVCKGSSLVAYSTSSMCFYTSIGIPYMRELV